MPRELFVTGLRLREPPAEDADSYVFRLPAVRRLGRLELRSRVTFFVGENGSGKSTLLEAVAVNCGFNAEGGTRNFSFSTCDTHSPLGRSLVVSRGTRRPRDGFFLRAESFYNVCTEIDRLDRADPAHPLLPSYGGVSLHERSHGESFLALLLHRFGGQGLYLLDEPEAALSPARQMTLLARVHQLAQGGSQFLIATHSPILMACPGAELYLLGEDGPRLTPYRETEHYAVTREFLNNPERMLRYLLEDD